MAAVTPSVQQLPSHDAKRTKRTRDVSEEMTLEEHIAARRRKLVEDRREAPALRARAAALRAEADAMTARWQTRLALDRRAQAREWEEEAAARESMAREHQFESTVVTYLRTYHQCTDAKPAMPATASRKSDTLEAYVRYTDLTKQRRATILDEYLTEMNQAPPKVAMAARDECPRCAGGTKLLLCTAHSTMSCPECGYTVAYLDTTSSSTAFEDVTQYSAYSYKRINHFVMWVTHAQGKEAHRVPDEILQAVMKELYETHGLRDPAQIKQPLVRSVLRKLKLRKAYDHVAQVCARLSGVRPLRITPKIEEQLRNMFLQMQPSFQRHAPKSRTNFLSYSFVLYRCFQILGLTHMLDGLSLLKGREKLEANDAIFRKICIDQGWPIFELPPA